MNRGDERLRSEQLHELIESGSNPSPSTVDREVAAAALLASELRRGATAPPSPREVALRTQLVARQSARRRRPIAAVPALAALLTALTAGIAFAALPIAEPARDALYRAAQQLLNSGATGTHAPAVPTPAPSDGSNASPAPGVVTPTPFGGGSGHTPVPAPSSKPGDPTAHPTDPDLFSAPPANPPALSPPPTQSDPPVPTSSPAAPAPSPEAPAPSSPAAVPSAVPDSSQLSAP